MDALDMTRLAGLGFVFDNNEWKWEHRVQSALIVYKEQYGNLLTPSRFVVPSRSPWAEETWGMNLGQAVLGIRNRGDFLRDDKPERKRWLDKMGFCWDDLERRWQLAKIMFVVYKEVHGDLLVPHSFVVPWGAPWAEDAWGAKLGIIVNTIRDQGHYLSDDKPERKEWLDKMGFVWDEFERRWEVTAAALVTYKEVHGGILIPHSFVVPASAPWAEAARGMNLGQAANNIRHLGHYLSDDKPERKEWLDEMGFHWRTTLETE
jgi:hypothetical protein